MKDIHNYYDIVDSSTLDIWKNIDFGDTLESTDYQLYELSNYDNLMGLSYRFYNTIDDWWIIYLFNNIYDINFSLITDSVIQKTIAKKLYNVQNYNNLIAIDKLKTLELIRNFYLVDNSLEDSIILTNNLLDSPITDDIFLKELSNYINIEIISNSFIKNKIKIPSFEIVLKMKNIMEEHSLTWS